jgi:hypothetical protein
MLKKLILVSIFPLILGTACKTTKDSTLVTTSQKEREVINTHSAELDTNIHIPGASTSMGFKVDTTDQKGRINTTISPVDGTGVFTTKDTSGVLIHTKTENKATGTVISDGKSLIFRCDCADTIASVRKYYESTYIDRSLVKDSVRTEFQEVVKTEYKTPMIIKIFAGLGFLSVTLLGFFTYNKLRKKLPI